MNGLVPVNIDIVLCWHQLSSIIKNSLPVIYSKKVNARSMYGIRHPITKLLTHHNFSPNFQDTSHPFCLCTFHGKETVEHYIALCR